VVAWDRRIRLADVDPGFRIRLEPEAALLIIRELAQGR
jgi:hypothetical protein